MHVCAGVSWFDASSVFLSPCLFIFDLGDGDNQRSIPLGVPDGAMLYGRQRLRGWPWLLRWRMHAPV